MLNIIAIEQPELQSIKDKLDSITRFISGFENKASPVYIPVNQVLEKYPMCRSTFEKQRRKGLNTYKIGGKVYCKVSEVEAFFENAKV